MAACALSCGAAPHPRSHRHSDGSGRISALARAIRGDRARVRSVAINRETTHNATPAGDPPAIPALPPRVTTPSSGALPRRLRQPLDREVEHDRNLRSHQQLPDVCGRPLV